MVSGVVHGGVSGAMMILGLGSVSKLEMTGSVALSESLSATADA